jgi:hypothetical protein
MQLQRGLEEFKSIVNLLQPLETRISTSSIPNPLSSYVKLSGRIDFVDDIFFRLDVDR